MKASETKYLNIENRTFLFLLSIVTIAFGVMLLPFYGSIFWAAILAIIFSPVQRLLDGKYPKSRNITTLLTLSTCVFVAIIPVILISFSLAKEGQVLYQQIQSGEINIGVYLDTARSIMPKSMQSMLEQYGLESNIGLKNKLSEVIMESSQFAANQVLNIGQNTFQFVVGIGIMIYLLFFFIRDGLSILDNIKKVLPLDERKKIRLFNMFVKVVRATVKGNIIVAVTQGVLGGIIFSVLGISGGVLWAVLMTFLSLVPAVGAGLVWLPAAIYFLLTGAIWQGIVLILFGVFVIGLVDNILRPILVGKDIKLPDYLVLISTLGGMVLVGINGFVIGPLIAALFISCWSLLNDGELENIEQKPGNQLS